MPSQRLYAAKKNTEAHKENIKSAEDCIKPENRSFIAVADILQDAIQNATEKNMVPYILAQPGMSREKVDDVKENL